MTEEKKDENMNLNENQTEAVVENNEEVKEVSEEVIVNTSEDKVEEKSETVEEVVEDKVEKTKSETEKEGAYKKTDKKPFNKRPQRRKNNFRRREAPEFEQKIVSLRRVTRVMAGGRRFSFSVAMVLGDKKGSVGFGVGKAGDTSLAIQKSIRNAKKNMVKLKLNPKDNSLLYDVSAKYKASEVTIRPVKGKGLAAGGAVRTVLELAGVDETGAKILSRSKNNINNVKATFKALEPFSTKRIVVEKKSTPFNRTKRRFPKKNFSKTNFTKQEK